MEVGLMDVQSSNVQIQSFMVKIVMKNVSVQEENAINLASVDNASKIILDRNVINVNVKMVELVMERIAHAPIIMKENFVSHRNV
jgi:hypothetical protein